MEKLLYVLWKKPEVATESFREELLQRTAPLVCVRGGRRLSVNIADEQAALGLRMAQSNLTAMVCVWMDSHLDRGPVEEALRALTARLAGYLVLESVPIVNTAQVPALGERLRAHYTVGFIEKPAALTYEDFLRIWQGSHTQVAIETQSTFLYIQNVCVRALTDNAPPWVCIVEEAFPPEAATDQLVFYDAETPEKLEANLKRMMDSCHRFIDYERFETYPMSAYVLKR
ncbi:MAG: EthD domain-containing protein [Candidatus Binatia bacterium]